MVRSIATETYEMKLFLKEHAYDKKLDAIKEEFATVFNLQPAVTVMPTQYLDTVSKDIDACKFNIRIRKKNTSTSTELTFKKRFSSPCCVEQGLVYAAEEGFDANNTLYTCEADCGNTGKTVSFSNESKSKLGYADAIQLPDLAKSVELINQFAPQDLKDLLVGKELKVFGPVFIYRYEGTFNDYPVRIEVMPVVSENGKGTQLVIELSFKTADRQFAYEFQSVLKDKLIELGIFKKKDVLKTQIVLDRY